MIFQPFCNAIFRFPNVIIIIFFISLYATLCLCSNFVLSLMLKHEANFFPLYATFCVKYEKLVFLDFLICKRNENISTTTYRKKTSSYIYLYWYFFSTRIVKRYHQNNISRKSIFNMVYPIVSKDELDHIRNAFPVNTNF